MTADPFIIAGYWTGYLFCRYWHRAMIYVDGTSYCCACGENYYWVKL